MNTQSALSGKRLSSINLFAIISIFVIAAGVFRPAAAIDLPPGFSSSDGVTLPSSSSDTSTNAPLEAQTGVTLSSGVTIQGSSISANPPVSPSTRSSPLPNFPNPFTSSIPVPFGSQLFVGRFADTQFSGFNPDYQLASNDRLNLRMWGAINYQATVNVDAQGNIFIPNVGPVKVLGVRNADLNLQVEEQVKRIFRSNVGLYVTLEVAQPVKIYVTGFVLAPGLYGGLSSNSILYYIDRAGGIDMGRGSFLDIKVMRNGRERAHYNLYNFLLNGVIDNVQLQDGDTIIVGPRQHTVWINGQVLSPYQFEFDHNVISAEELFGMAKPVPAATHFSVVRIDGVEKRSEYHPISESKNVQIRDGDVVTVTADKYPGTILVRVDGAHLGEHTLILPYGSKLKDVLARIKPAPQANMEAAQLFRASVAARQKEMLQASLQALESSVLTARSSTVEEAQLRTSEANLMTQFIKTASNIEMKGQVLLAGNKQSGETLISDGDRINIPEATSLIMVHGEVLFPNAIVYNPKMTVDDYIGQSGGYTQNADNSRIVVFHQDGSFSDGKSAHMIAGDEIMVLPKVDSKNIEITRGITQIIYQIAIAAKVLIGI